MNTTLPVERYGMHVDRFSYKTYYKGNNKLSAYCLIL